MFKNKSKNKIFIFILIASVLVKLFFGIYYWDKLNYFEFGAIAQNIVAGQGYSFYYHENGVLEYNFKPNSDPYPSAYIPAGYVIYLLPFFQIQSDGLRNWLFMIVNIALHTLTAIMIFNLTQRYFDSKTAIIATALYLFLPDMVYSVFSVGPTIFYHMGIIGLLLIESRVNDDRKPYFFGISFGLLMLFRPEVLLIIFFYLFREAIRNKWKSIFIILILTVVIQMPWIIRNYAVFEAFIPLQTSSGLNLYRGNNSYGSGVWADDRIAKKLNDTTIGDQFEVELNEFYLQEALGYIFNNPEKAIESVPGKLFDLLIYSRFDNRNASMIFLIPWFLVIVLCILGIFKAGNYKKFGLIFMVLMGHLALAIIFFSLPRHQTMMKIALIPFAAFGLSILSTKFQKK